MKKFYLISLTEPGNERLERMLKDSFENWMHYIDCTWCVVSELGVNEITDKLSPYVQDGNNYHRFIVSEIDPTQVNGRLPRTAWNWFNTNRLKIEYQNMESPSLMDMFRCGIFAPELDRANSIADIDDSLRPYENCASWFELDAVRNRMVDVLMHKVRCRYENR